MSYATNRPLSRRNFLRAAAAAPIAIKAGGAKAVIAKLAESDVLQKTGVLIAPDVPVASGIGMIVRNKTLFAMWKAGILPQWARDDVEHEISYFEGSRLSPDVAALRSVSTSAKFRIHSDRVRKRTWGQLDRQHLNAIARDVFVKRMDGDSNQAVPASGGLL